MEDRLEVEVPDVEQGRRQGHRFAGLSGPIDSQSDCIGIAIQRRVDDVNAGSLELRAGLYGHNALAHAERLH